MRTRAVFLDRDGTLIADKHYLSEPDGVELLPGVGDALALLQRAGCRLFMVSNQSGISRGYYSQRAVQACQARLDSLLSVFGVRLDAAVWCPHAPDDHCACRKPQIGLWKGLAARHGLTAQTSAMIGDKMVDLAFGAHAGMALGVLVLTGKGHREAHDAGFPLPATDGQPILIAQPSLAQSGVAQVCARRSRGAQSRELIAPDLLSAARWILENE